MVRADNRAAFLRHRGFRAVLVILASLSSLSWHTAKAAFALTTRTYMPSDETIVNPERGFFHQPGDCDNYDFTAGQLGAYRQEPDRISVVRCIFYLGMAKTIDPTQITRFRHQA